MFGRKKKDTGDEDPVVTDLRQKLAEKETENKRLKQELAAARSHSGGGSGPGIGTTAEKPGIE